MYVYIVYINIQYPHLSNNNTSYPKTNSKKYFFKFVHLNQPSNEKKIKKSRHWKITIFFNLSQPSQLISDEKTLRRGDF